MNNKKSKLDILKEFGISEKLVGSELAQVILLCVGVENLTRHIVPMTINESDFDGMSQKGINILKSVYLGTGHKHDYSAKRAIQGKVSHITNKLRYIKKKQKETYNKSIGQLKERFQFIRNKS